MEKYATGIRFLKGFDVASKKEINRVDVLLLKVLNDGAETITANAGDQFHFSFDPDNATKEQIASCLRELADKIQHVNE